MNCAAIQIMPFGHFTAEANSWPQVKSFYQDMREHNKKMYRHNTISERSDRHLSLVTCYLFPLFPTSCGLFSLSAQYLVIL